MKTLYLVRHSKSSWEEPGVGDVNRPLLEKGIEKAKKAVSFLNERGVKADKIISSHATRAYETAKLIAKGIGFPEEKISIQPKIYEGNISNILDLVFATEDEVDSLMVFGHNPNITYLANLFVDPKVEIIPTMGIACISFQTDDWASITLAERKTEFVLFRKPLED